MLKLNYKTGLSLLLFKISKCIKYTQLINWTKLYICIASSSHIRVSSSWVQWRPMPQSSYNVATYLHTKTPHYYSQTLCYRSCLVCRNSWFHVTYQCGCVHNTRKVEILILKNGKPTIGNSNIMIGIVLL